MAQYLKETPSQTAGPYVHIGLAPAAAGFEIFDNALGQDIAGPNAQGKRIRVEGHVIDGTGSPVRDVLIETWQANAQGIYAGAGEVEADFSGWGRVISDFETGKWRFDTVKPGIVPDAQGRVFAPHINLWIVARGINMGLQTKMFFDDEAEANAADPVLNGIEWVNRRPTLIARRDTDGDTYHFDIRLQGDNETVFFDI